MVKIGGEILRDQRAVPLSPLVKVVLLHLAMMYIYINTTYARKDVNTILCM